MLEEVIGKHILILVSLIASFWFTASKTKISNIVSEIRLQGWIKDFVIEGVRKTKKVYNNDTKNINNAFEDPKYTES